MAQLGANAFGEVLEPGRVPDCYLGLLLHDADSAEAAGVLIVSPAALLHPSVPQPDGMLLYELLTGQPDRTAHEPVFVADLTVELRAWPTDTWAKVGVDLKHAAAAVIGCWRRGDVGRLHQPLEPGEDQWALVRPMMALARAQLRARPAGLVAAAWRRWQHPSSARQVDERFR